MQTRIFVLRIAAVLIASSLSTGAAAANLISNGSFDANVNGWLANNPSSDVTWDGANDANGSATSGSMQIGQIDFLNFSVGASQCLVASISGDYSFGFKTRLATISNVNMTCSSFASLNCSGTATATATNGDATANTTTWTSSDQTTVLAVPTGTNSVNCALTFALLTRPAGRAPQPQATLITGRFDDAFFSAVTVPVTLQSFDVN